MKRIMALVSLVVLMVSMVVVPQALAASPAQNFAGKATAEIGKTGKYFGYTDEWCAMFVKRCADRAGIGGSVPAQYNTAAMARWFHQNGNRFALTRRNASGTIQSWSRGTWSSNLPAANYKFVPAVGDICFFETGTSASAIADGIDHVGIVVAVSGNSVTVVEGNTGNKNNSLSKVSKNTYNWKQNNSKIWGFARPSACGSMPKTSSSTPAPVVKTTVASLIGSKTCRGYLRLASNQRAYSKSSLAASTHDGSWIYTNDYCRIVRAEGNSLLVEYPTSRGTKQRWVAASSFFCQFSYSVWSKTARQNITVMSRPGAGLKVGAIYKNDCVYVLGESGSFYQVLYPAGGNIWKFGFISKSAL